VIAMAMQIVPPVFADENDTFRKLLHVKSVPHIMVVDNHQKMIAEGSAALDWINNEINTNSREH